MLILWTVSTMVVELMLNSVARNEPVKVFSEIVKQKSGLESEISWT